MLHCPLPRVAAATKPPQGAGHNRSAWEPSTSCATARPRLAPPITTNSAPWAYSNASGGHVVVADATSFVTLATPAYAVSNPPADRVELVPGPAGQVTLRSGSTYFNVPATEVWLFTSPQLP